jgi:hypothetical protein
LEGAIQVPQCGGTNTEKTILDGGWTEPVTSFVLQLKDGVYRVAAGRIHGVTEGTEFTVYANSSDGDALGVLACTAVTAHNAVLAPTNGLPNLPLAIPPQGARAVIIAWKNAESVLKLFSNDSGALAYQLEQASPPPLTHFRLECVADISVADVLVSTDPTSGDVLLETTDPLFREFDHVHRLAVPDDKLATVLTHLAQFRYHLLRQGAQGQERFRDIESAGIFGKEGNEVIEMRMYRVEAELWLNASFDTKRNFMSARRATITASHTEKYGVELVSNSDYALFPYLFAFDLSDYSVTVR